MSKKNAFQKAADKIKSTFAGDKTAASLATENGTHSEQDSGNTPTDSTVTPQQAALGIRPNLYLEALNKAKRPMTRAVDNSERDSFADKVVTSNAE